MGAGGATLPLQARLLAGVLPWASAAQHYRSLLNPGPRALRAEVCRQQQAAS